MHGDVALRAAPDETRPCQVGDAVEESALFQQPAQVRSRLHLIHKILILRFIALITSGGYRVVEGLREPRHLLGIEKLSQEDVPEGFEMPLLCVCEHDGLLIE